MKWDINADLGEGEPAARTKSLLRWITLANVACGGHAGDLGSMERCVRWAKREGVQVGAHPGLGGTTGFGRGEATVTSQALATLLLQQVGALECVARSQGMRLHHVKLHGALYHRTDEDMSLARAYLGVIRHYWPGLVVVARAGGRVETMARKMGLKVWAEGFLDRGYAADGRLVPRGEPGALLTEWAEVEARLQELREGGWLRSVEGKELRWRLRTLCVHADTPGAVRWARRAALTLGLQRRR